MNTGGHLFLCETTAKHLAYTHSPLDPTLVPRDRITFRLYEVLQQLLQSSCQYLFHDHGGIRPWRNAMPGEESTADISVADIEDGGYTTLICQILTAGSISYFQENAQETLQSQVSLEIDKFLRAYLSMI